MVDVVHEGAPEPLVIKAALLAVTMDDRVFALVVYRSVFVPPNELTPVPPFATDRVEDDNTPLASLCTAPAPKPERMMFPVSPPPSVRPLFCRA